MQCLVLPKLALSRGGEMSAKGKSSPWDLPTWRGPRSFPASQQGMWGKPLDCRKEAIKGNGSNISQHRRKGRSHCVFWESHELLPPPARCTVLKCCSRKTALPPLPPTLSTRKPFPRCRGFGPLGEDQPHTAVAQESDIFGG